MATTRVRDVTDRGAGDRLHAERATAEAISRRNESMANVFAGRVARHDNDEMSQRLKGANKEFAESQKREQELQEEEAPRNFEGTRPTMADSLGNFAPTAEVATVGGIGVQASNSDKSGNPATTSEQVVEAAEEDPAPPVIAGFGGRAQDMSGNAGPLVVQGGDAAPGSDKVRQGTERSQQGRKTGKGRGK